MKYRHRLTQINTDKMKRINPCKSVSQIEGSYSFYATRKGEMKATGQTGNREGAKAKESEKKCFEGTQPPQEPKALYTPSFYWRKKGGINRGSFNNGIEKGEELMKINMIKDKLNLNISHSSYHKQMGAPAAWAL